MLPFKAATMGDDEKVIALVKEMFSVDPLQQGDLTETVVSANAAGGKALFIPQPDALKLKAVLDEYCAAADVIFTDNPVLKTDMGKLNYIHKIKDDKHIFFFTNSSDEAISTDVLLRGKLKPGEWNPHSGMINKNIAYNYEKINGQLFTRFQLQLEAVKSLFVICDDK
jgi:hypothetical protein